MTGFGSVPNPDPIHLSTEHNHLLLRVLFMTIISFLSLRRSAREIWNMFNKCNIARDIPFPGTRMKTFVTFLIWTISKKDSSNRSWIKLLSINTLIVYKTQIPKNTGKKGKLFPIRRQDKNLCLPFKVSRGYTIYQIYTSKKNIPSKLF